MAGNPYTESGEKFQIPDMLANRADTYNLGDIIGNYLPEVALSRAAINEYLSFNISYSVDESMRKGMELYFKLAAKHQLIGENKELRFAR